MMILHWYQWMALAALWICLAACLFHFVRLVRSGKPLDYSRQAGKTGGSIRYAFTGAMSPTKKESAFLHLPTYTAGLFYHMGTFLSLILFFFIMADVMPTGWVAVALMAFLFVSSFSGMAILLKRIVKKELRSLSNPDDFISNSLVSLFQLSSLILLLVSTAQLPNWPTGQLPNWPAAQLAYYLTFTLLTLYLPVGKLKHTVYFFAARYHLGYFFGWRGVWPPNGVKK